MDKKKYATLSDLNKDKQDDSGKTAKHYTGSDQSGTYNQDPDDMFNQLQKQAQQQKQSGQLKEKNDFKLVIYNNGFQVNDDPFVPLSPPEMEGFMNKLKQSQVPNQLRETIQKYGNDVQPDIQVKMEDYRPPTPPKYIAYSGEGVSLGGNQAETGKINLEKGKIHIDSNKPTTNIQIRLHDGTTKNIEINITDSVGTLYDYVSEIAPVQGTFQIYAGFPLKPLTDRNATIEDADLEDSRIQQKVE